MMTQKWPFKVSKSRIQRLSTPDTKHDMGRKFKKNEPKKNQKKKPIRPSKRIVQKY